MKCPRCETSMLEERERDGVTTDVCQKCRGIWLDRGELERLIARAIEEQNATERKSGFDRDDDDDFGRHDSRTRRDEFQGNDDRGNPDGRGRKRRWYESLTDMFD
jgi:Zn-finger nucleic acid-binding protein